MIDNLVKLSGKTHEASIESKTITRDNQRIVNKNEGRISYTMTTKEKSVIEFNDLLFIPPFNSVVFRAGSSPVWNRRETALPMSWRLLQNTIKDPRREYSLQTVPTLSTAMDFDVRKNQPNFYAMLEKRLLQARRVDRVRERYMEVYGYSEFDMEQLDVDVLSDELMSAVNQSLFKTETQKSEWQAKGYKSEADYVAAQRLQNEQRLAAQGDQFVRSSENNKELEHEVAELQREESRENLKIYGDGTISRRHLYHNHTHQVNGSLNALLSEAYQETKQYFANDPHFVFDKNTQEIRGADDGLLYVKAMTGANEADFKKMEEAEGALDARVFGEESVDPNKTLMFEITDDFIRFLVKQDSWKHFAEGRFDIEAGRIFRRDKEFQ